MPKMKKAASLEEKVAQRLAKTTTAAGLNAAAFPYLNDLTPKETPQTDEEQTESAESAGAEEA